MPREVVRRDVAAREHHLGPPDVVGEERGLPGSESLGKIRKVIVDVRQALGPSSCAVTLGQLGLTRVLLSDHRFGEFAALRVQRVACKP